MPTRVNFFEDIPALENDAAVIVEPWMSSGIAVKQSLPATGETV